MSHNILVTGASGYLGGTLLNRWSEANLPAYGKLFALVRSQAQADAVKQYGAEPLTFSPVDEAAVKEAVLKHQIDIVFYLIDARKSESQILFIKALEERKKTTGKEVHFLHTSGAKMFSSLVSHPTDRPLLDTNPGLYNIQKTSKSPYPVMQEALDTNCSIIEQGEARGVRTYIFVPCIVYGKGEGFGNPISIQTVAIVKAAKALGQIYKVTPGRPKWPVVHVIDNSTLYLSLLKSILREENPGYGKQGYYLASPGSVVWDDLYAAIAAALAKRGIIKNDTIETADDAALEKMASALGVDKSMVEVSLAGECAFTAVHGKEIGWQPQFPPEHILEAADAEVELILNHLK